MLVTQFQDDDALLDYSLATAPSPLQVSSSENATSYGTLTFVISNSGDDVTVTSITIALPVGDPSSPDGADLTESTTGIGCSATPESAWTVDAEAGVPGTFIVKPATNTNGVVGDPGFAVTLSNIQISTECGTAAITITENASRSQDGLPMGDRTTTLTVAKFPYGFSAGDFTLASPLIDNGQSAVLSWYGSESIKTTYTMLFGTQSVNVTDLRQWTSPALTDTTTFILRIDAPAPSGDPMTVSFSATQIVASPDIVAKSVTADTATVTGSAVVGGDLRLDGVVDLQGGCVVRDPVPLGTVWGRGAWFNMMLAPIELELDTKCVANGDGFVVVILPPIDGQGTSAEISAVLWGGDESEATVWVRESTTNGEARSLCLPVPANGVFSTDATSDSAHAYWFPLGTPLNQASIQTQD